MSALAMQDIATPLQAKAASFAAQSLKKQAGQKARALDMIWSLQDAGEADVTCSELTREWLARSNSGCRMHPGIMSRVIGDLRASGLVVNATPRLCSTGTRVTVVPVRAVKRLGEVV